MPRGPRNLRISFDGVGLTSFGGVALLRKFFQHLGIRGQLSRSVRFPQRNNEYSISEMIESLLHPLILGLGREETTEPLRNNGVFQYLAGLPGYPAATTLRRFLRRFARAGLPQFLALHDRWRKEMLSRPKRLKKAILDFDATVLTVYGKQQGSAIGFNPKKRGRPSYMPLLCFEGQTGDVIAGSYQPGNTHPIMAAEQILGEVFAKLPGGAGQVRIRGDAAFFGHRFVESVEAKKGYYAIVSKLPKPLRNKLGGIRYRRVSRGVSAGEFKYQPEGWKNRKRFVVIRRPIPEEPSAQLHLFQVEGYTYQVFVTNMALKPLNLWRFYNQRSTAELIIRELKDAYALGKIPSKDFAANEAFFHIVLLAYNLLSWFKRLCAPPRWQRATLPTLRQKLLFVPAQFVRPGGTPTLRIAPGFTRPDDFIDVMKRITKIKPLGDPTAKRRPKRRAK
jgi:hypothetical protein